MFKAITLEVTLISNLNAKRAQKSDATRYLYGAYSDNQCALKIFLDLPKESSIALGSMQSSGVVHGTPVWETTWEHSCGRSFILQTFTHHFFQAQGLGSGRGNTKMTNNQWLTLGSDSPEQDIYLSNNNVVCRGLYRKRGAQKRGPNSVFWGLEGFLEEMMFFFAESWKDRSLLAPWRGS